MSVILPSLPNSVRIINSKSSTVGLRHQGRSYVIGFTSTPQSGNHAKIVHDYLKADTSLRLRNVHLTNIIKDLEIIVPDLATAIETDKVMLATNAMLLIEKGHKNDKFHNQQISMEEFMLYPFSKNIGVVITNDITDIANNHIVFDVHIIAPAFSTALFENF